jgi:hypothetical protein
MEFSVLFGELDYLLLSLEVTIEHQVAVARIA